ncbi:MAG: hypothetical protein ACTSYI_05455 [Promethearchaeota archaeon]
MEQIQGELIEWGNILIKIKQSSIKIKEVKKMETKIKTYHTIRTVLENRWKVCSMEFSPLERDDFFRKKIAADANNNTLILIFISLADENRSQIFAPHLNGILSSLKLIFWKMD